MAEKTSPSDRVASAVPARGPASVRNIVLIGPSGGGKTTLAEGLLVAAGAITRAGTIAGGNTVCDGDDAEVRQQRSINLALAPLFHHGIKVNLIDTPGYADFVGELRAGLRAADCALFVIAANEEVDEATAALWHECDDVGMPRAVVISKLDHQRADYPRVLAAVQQAFSGRVLPLYVPSYPARLGALLSQTTIEYSAGGERIVADSAHGADGSDGSDDLRGELIEGIIEESEDESLMDRYLGGEELDTGALIDDLETAIARGTLFPVLPVCGPSLFGTHELLEVVTSAFPPPGEHRMPDVFTPAGGSVAAVGSDPQGPLLAEVVKTTSDPYVGRVSLVRVFSGTVRPEKVVHVSGHGGSILGTDSARWADHPDHDEDERVGTLTIPFGSKIYRPATAVLAGDICAIGRLSRAETGDTLSDKESPLVLRPWSMPEPLLPLAIEAHAKADEDKLAQGLTRLAAEDPTLRVENNPHTHQLVLWCMGEAHADVVLEQLRTRYGAAVDIVDLKVSLRETFSSPARGHGRHVKQSGGHGQFAVCDITIEPLEDPLAFEFVDKVVGGAVPRQYIPSVEKGIRAQMERGIATGNPLAGFRAILVDGKAHSVDSSDAAFQMAGSLALKDAAGAAAMSLLEPVDLVEVTVPDELVGPVMSDLSGRRGRLLGTDQLTGHTVVRTEVPAIELRRYPVDLRSLTRGTATFTRAFVRYEPMPDHVARQLVAGS